MTTLSIKIYSLIRTSITPEINAASTILLVFTTISVALMLVYQNKVKEK